MKYFEHKVSYLYLRYEVLLMIIKLYSILEERELKIPSDKLNKISNDIWHYTLTTPSIAFFLGKTAENFIEETADKRYLLVKKFLKSNTFIKHGPFEEVAGDLPLGFKIGIYATNYNGKTVVISEYAEVFGG